MRARNQPMPAQSTFRPQPHDRPVQWRHEASQPRYYRPELDILRFTAFFMVFLSHVVPGDETFFAEAGMPSALARLIIFAAAGGAFGVDLFFVLSAFLITTLLLREQQSGGKIDVARFYARRILRIWPLYFAFLFFASTLAKYMVPGDEFSPKYIAAFVLLAGNWACVWWGLPHSVAGPLWSVSVEEQFYLSWPIVMRHAMNHLAPVAFALLIISFLVRAFLVSHGAVHPQIWCNTLARLDPIACGALLALWAERVKVDPPSWMRVVLIVFGCAVFVAAARYGDFVGNRALITYPAITGGCIALMLGSLGLPLPAGSNRTVRAFIYLGRISYGLYVFHLFFVETFRVTSSHEPIARLSRAAAALLTTVGVSAVSYRYFETPFLRLKERLARVQSRPI